MNHGPLCNLHVSLAATAAAARKNIKARGGADVNGGSKTGK